MRLNPGNIPQFFVLSLNSIDILQSLHDQILESIDDAFIALDKNWFVTYWNKEAEKLLGRSKDEMIGQLIWDVYADVIDSDFYRYYHDAVADGKPRHFEA